MLRRIGNQENQMKICNTILHLLKLTKIKNLTVQVLEDVDLSYCCGSECFENNLTLPVK